jgi:preprotein translocase subunit SecG
MQTLIMVFHVLAAVAIVVLVLLQHGKGADMGAAFGSGSAGSLFGSSGAANFLSRATGALAAVFFVTSLGLTFLSASPSKSGGVTQTIKSDAGTPAASQPAAPAPSAPAPSGNPASKSGEIPK